MGVIRVGDVIHVPLRGRDAVAFLVDDVHPRILAVQPNRGGRTGDVQDDPNPRRVHLIHHPVEPGELKLARLRLKRVPRQVPHADHVEPGPLHDRDVRLDLLRGPIDRLVAGADKHIARSGEVGRAMADVWGKNLGGIHGALGRGEGGQRGREKASNAGRSDPPSSLRAQEGFHVWVR